MPNIKLSSLYNNTTNNIDIINKKNLDKTDIYKQSVKNTLERKKEINSQIKNNIDVENYHENDAFFQNTTQIINSEKLYQDSSFLLEKIKEQKENNLLKKYNIEKKYISTQIDNNQDINNISMKKKLLIIPLQIFSTTQ